MNDVELAAGQELDRLIAEKVMGWKRSEVDGVYERPGHPGLMVVSGPPTWSPSTEIAAAWQVIAKLARPLKVVWTGKVWICEVFGEPCSEEANTAPLAICRASLKADKGIEAAGAL